MFDEDADEDEYEESNGEEDEDEEYPDHEAEADSYKELDVCPYCGTLLNLINEQVNCPNCGAVF